MVSRTLVSFETQDHDYKEGDAFPLVDPDEDAEIKEVKVLVTNICTGTLGTKRFSLWKRLVSAIACLRHISNSFHHKNTCKGWHVCEKSRTVEMFEDAVNFVLKEVQHEVYVKEINCLRENKPVPRSSSILCLDPLIGTDDLLRVGGRLDKAKQLLSRKKNPVILPGKHHIVKLLVTHFHESVKHQ